MSIINSEGLNLIINSEGLRLNAYPDPATGNQPWTIGIGTITYPNGTRVKKGDTITKEQAIQFLEHDLQRFKNSVLDLVDVPLNQNQLAALTSFVYNVGVGAFSSSTLLKLLNKGDFNGAANQFTRWNKANGKVLPGLTTRRQNERSLFLKPVQNKIENENDSQIKTLTILNNTFFKKLFDTKNLKLIPQSPSLPSNQKKLVTANTKLQYLAHTKLLDHYLITFKDSLTADDNHSSYNTWLVFSGHIDLDNNGIPENQKDITPAQKIIDFLKTKNYNVFTGPGESNIICLEALNPNFTLNKNTPNEFNDLRLIIQFINGKPVIVSSEICTVSPGRFYTLNPLNPNGAAWLTYGQHLAWQIGFHKKENHPALVQTLPLTVTRDLNKDFSPVGDKTFTGLFGINLHHSFGQPKSNIGTSSAGCIVGLIISLHFAFIEKLKKDPRYQKNRKFIFTVSLIKGLDVF